MAQEDLDLIRSEEASGTCMITMAEAKMISAGADEMRFLVVAGLTHLHKAIWIELKCVVVSIGIPHVRHISDDLVALLEDVTVGKCNICCRDPPESTLRKMLEGDDVLL